MLQRVQSFFERHPEADGCIRPYLTRLLDCPDPDVQQKLRDCEPFCEITLPQERFPLPPQVQEAEREVIEYLYQNDLALERLSRTARIAELTASVLPDDRPVSCPWCGTGELRADASPATDDDETTGFYYPRQGYRCSDGSLEIHASWYDCDGHSSGFKEVVATDPDDELWCWICDRSKRFARVTDDDLPKIRDEFRHWQRGWLPWAWHRLTHRRRSGWVRSGRD